jgi:hypothetical protein
MFVSLMFIHFPGESPMQSLISMKVGPKPRINVTQFHGEVKSTTKFCNIVKKHAGLYLVHFIFETTRCKQVYSISRTSGCKLLVHYGS